MSGTVHDTNFCSCRLRGGQTYKGYQIQYNGRRFWQAIPVNGNLNRAIFRRTSRAVKHKIDEYEVVDEEYKRRCMNKKAKAAHRECEQIECRALTDYMRIAGLARAKYQRVESKAWGECQRVMSRALANCDVGLWYRAQNRYAWDKSVAWGDYEQSKSKAWVECRQVIGQARAECERILSEARDI
jgi:hypothetical protein